MIVGLGNPGEKYENTRHNAGFRVLDQIAKKKNLTFSYKKEFETRFCEIGVAKLAQPQTYMNESGRAVAKLKNYWKISSPDILVVYDDVDLDPGKIRITFGGSSAGHKGVQSVIDNIGEDFWRMRLGIGKNEKVTTEKWVLQKFTAAENKIIIRIVDTVVDKMLKSLSNNLKEETIKI